MIIKQHMYMAYYIAYAHEHVPVTYRDLHVMFHYSPQITTRNIGCIPYHAYDMIGKISALGSMPLNLH